MNDDRLRLSDSEREVAVSALGEHFAQGRLSSEEHTERIGRAWQAKTQGEIPGLFADLPGGSPLHPAPRFVPAGPPLDPRAWPPVQAVRRRTSGFPVGLKVLLGILLVALVIANWPLIVMVGVLWLLLHRGRGGRPAGRVARSRW